MSTPADKAAPPAAPPSDVVNVEVDGKVVQGKKGQMIIHVTDAENAYVPRFCYHDKLAVAANCRMCLVEVEKAPKLAQAIKAWLAQMHMNIHETGQ